MKDDVEEIVRLYTEEKLSVLKICECMYGSPRAKIHSVYSTLKKSGVYLEDRNRTFKRKYVFDEGFFDKIDTEEKAYFLGFIAADGYIGESDNRVTISVNSVDRDILEKFLSAIGSTLKVVDFVKDKKYAHSKASACSKKMVESLVSKGLRQSKSTSMTADVFSHIPQELQRHFLRGYFDGDGCMTLGVKYSSGVKYLIQIVGTESFLTGTFSKVFPTTCKLHKYSTCNMYCYKISSKKSVLEFLEFLYSDSSVFLNRKKQKFCAHVKPGELLEAL